MAPSTDLSDEDDSSSQVHQQPDSTVASSSIDPASGDVDGEIHYPPMGFGKHKPKMLLMGLKRSGKSSISSVVFRKMAPQDTLFLEATTTIHKESMQSFMDFQIWDMPGQIDYLDGSFDVDSIFTGVGGIVWVIDAQDNYMEPIGRVTDTILQLTELYPEIKYSVFIHKTDSLTEDYREDTIRDIMQKTSDELFDNGLENPPVSFHATSIYDHSIFEAFSKVIQGLVPQLPTYEALLNTVAATCRFQKVYIIDVMSKVYIASDSSPADTDAYELCCDYVNAIMDLSDMYGWDRKQQQAPDARTKDICAHTAESMVSCVRNHTLYLREINAFLAMIGVSTEPKFQQEKAMVDFNVQTFQDTMIQVLDRS
ncbi:MAG: hypothetical protein LQ348_005828 [Seirophora lacunosa]|nr:MAG: hypothetical protein LQ348_005828 [Seirophora lacunosa]